MATTRLSRPAGLWTVLLTVVLLAACAAPAGTHDPTITSNPKPLLSETRFYTDPENPAAAWLRTAAPSDPAATLVRTRIAGHVVGHPINVATDQVAAETSRYVQSAAANHATPVLLAESDSSGACTPEVRHRWFDALARGISGAPALVVIRGGSACPATRAAILADGVRALAAPSTLLLLDATDIATPQNAVSLLTASDIRDTLGFTLNIGGYTPDPAIAATAKTIRSGLQATTGRNDLLYLVDTSHNGGTTTTDCNPTGARIGPNITLSPDPSKAQNLWLTTPGASDGACGIAPHSRAGVFEPELARALTAGWAPSR
ncbi:glycoside hydrolase family 6 protein [Amycolatopsis sp. NPDC049253]|uniref:glycoside hydrolase family 6 protein n=1 Tax=Amycolatopsis sp. NPDC049253 TaxID=3155274 RepID=UPI003436031D